MKKILIIAAFISCNTMVFGQGSGSVRFELGEGLNIQFNNGQHNFKLGGYLQMDGNYESTKDLDAEYGFGIRKTYLSFSGDFYNDKLSFMLQMNYTDAYPLLDAWIGYKPCNLIKISVGQKQAFSGPRSMMIYDQALALGNSSLSDRTFFASGRELGVFVESRIPVKMMGIDLGVAVTSGDGRNAFGSSSLDPDLGGLKYTARATVYPLGFFTGNNELTGTDFVREKSLKLAIGGTFSYNNGASNKIGEGHGDFNLFDAEGKKAYPDYQKISADILMKYQGFTLLAEYTNASGQGIHGLFVDATPSGALKPLQIANYLVLGNGLTVQAGYLFKNNWAVDAMYSSVTPEWKENQTLIKTSSSYTFGVARYFVDNRLKVQLYGSYMDYPDMTTANKSISAGVIAHVVF